MFLCFKASLGQIALLKDFTKCVRKRLRDIFRSAKLNRWSAENFQRASYLVILLKFYNKTVQLIFL